MIVPCEIFFRVAFHLHYLDLPSFARVCKAFLTVIRDEYFWKERVHHHLEHISTDNPAYKYINRIVQERLYDFPLQHDIRWMYTPCNTAHSVYKYMLVDQMTKTYNEKVTRCELDNVKQLVDLPFVNPKSTHTEYKAFSPNNINLYTFLLTKKRYVASLPNAKELMSSPHGTCIVKYFCPYYKRSIENTIAKRLYSFFIGKVYYTLTTSKLSVDNHGCITFYIESDNINYKAFSPFKFTIPKLGSIEVTDIDMRWIYPYSIHNTVLVYE